MSYRRPAPVVACISLEPWDATWRRNQHLASRLIDRGHVSRLVFVEPPVLGREASRATPMKGVSAVRPALRIPKRAGGLRLAGAELHRGPLREVDVVWVNDPQLGVHCLRRGVPAVYDVTDDWRNFPQPDHIVRRIVQAEDALARRADTIVCSRVLAERWVERYGVRAHVVQNAVDVQAFAVAQPRRLDGDGPHLGYVGTVHSARLDVDLVLALADATPGTVHLVGPDALEAGTRAALAAHPRVVLHGAVPTEDVPGWMLAMDVLLCPHLVDPFTLSLDAIKSYEYLAAGRPVVATPTSGFQLLTGTGLHVVEASAFVRTCLTAVGTAPTGQRVDGWDDRADRFAALLTAQ